MPANNKTSTMADAITRLAVGLSTLGPLARIPRVFLRVLLPVFLLVQLFLPLYAISWRWGILVLLTAHSPWVPLPSAAPPVSPPAAWLCTLLPLLLGLSWALPWGHALLRGGYRARRSRLVSAVPSAIMQIPVREDDHGNAWFRHCEVCDIDMPNRWYHCEEFGICLPRHSHYCSYLPVPVCAYTQKAYLLGLLFLPAHLAFTIVVGFYLLINPHTRGPLEIAFGALMGVGCVLTVFVVCMAAGLWLSIVCRNARAPERAVKILLTSTYGITEELHASGRPVWDLGFKKNVWMNLGSVWDWFKLWKDPPVFEHLMQDDKESVADWVWQASEALEERYILAVDVDIFVWVDLPRTSPNFSPSSSLRGLAPSTISAQSSADTDASIQAIYPRRRHAFSSDDQE